MSRRRLTVVTSGHPSTCPRMTKAADAAAAAGYDVRLISVNYIDWAAALDQTLVATRAWRWRPIELDRRARPVASRWISARQRMARTASAVVGASATPAAVIKRAYARTHSELMQAILEEPFDFVYGGTVGALAATADAARRAGRGFALDFEDYHPAESEEPDAPLTHALADRILRLAVRGAAFVTTASVPMAKAYADAYGVAPLVIHNVVPRADDRPAAGALAGPLKLYWFSQVVGPKRGLEDVVRAVAVANIGAELHLRGAVRDEYVESLRRLASEHDARLTIIVHEPAPPDQMVDLCREAHIGLSLEQEGVRNRALCLPNKPLTYLAAGLAVIATDTPGQLELSENTGEAIWWYRPGDVPRLAEGLRLWDRDRAALARARNASLAAARGRWHWEHELERGAFLRALADARA